MMGYLTLMNTNYAYRLRTKALFEPNQPTVCFDVFVVDGINRLKEYRLQENLWRETLLLNFLKPYPDQVAPVVSFGQLTNNLIYREIKEIWGITLEEYIEKQFSTLRDKSSVYEDESQSQPTVFSEVEAIDLILKVIDLTSMLHNQKLVHTNLCPREIFLREGDIEKMCFLSLYHTSWSPSQVLGIDLPNVSETTLRFDMRTRNTEFISPEQAKIGKELQAIAA